MIILAVRYDKLSNLEFILMSIVLLFLLYLYTSPIDLKESFTMNSLKQVSFSEYQNKLFSLPMQVQDILMPKLTHVETAFKRDPDDKRKETHTLDQEEYIKKKDTYVVDLSPEGTATLNNDKWINMCREYRDIDAALIQVQSVNQTVWDKITDFQE